MDYSQPGSSVHGDSPGKNTGEGCHALLQGIFPTQVSCISGGFFPSEPTGKPIYSANFPDNISHIEFIRTCFMA